MATLEENVAEFRENVLVQEDAVRSGDHRRGNRYAKAYLAAFEQLTRGVDRGRDALSVLL
jgi:hypothetical protein